MEEGGLYEKTWFRQTKKWTESLWPFTRTNVTDSSPTVARRERQRRWLFQSIVKVVAMHPSTQHAYNADQAAQNQPENQ